MSLPHFWSMVQRKILRFEQMPRSKQAGRWIHFCMNQLRTLNSYQIFKIKNEKYKSYNGLCPFQGLSNGTTLMQIQSGQTVPLIHDWVHSKIA